VNRIVRRSLVGLVLLTTVVTLSAFWPAIPEIDKQSPLVAISPPPSHIEWTQHPVGGLIICQPPDPTGKLNCLTLPPGSILAIPRLVEGADPDSARDQS
jgi:hypothetical protein